MELRGELVDTAAPGDENLLTQDKSVKVGIEAKRKRAGWDEAYLLKILSL